MNNANKTLPKKPDIDEASGQAFLRDHIVDRASEARLRHGPYWDRNSIEALLKDERCVRFPVRLEFNAEVLEPGEFAFMQQNNPDTPKDGFTLFIHSHFANREDALPFLVAYHLVVFNYGDIADAEEDELFGAALMNMEQEEYYQTVCMFANEIAPRGCGH